MTSSSAWAPFLFRSLSLYLPLWSACGTDTYSAVLFCCNCDGMKHILQKHGAIIAVHDTHTLTHTRLKMFVNESSNQKFSSRVILFLKLASFVCAWLRVGIVSIIVIVTIRPIIELEPPLALPFGSSVGARPYMTTATSPAGQDALHSNACPVRRQQYNETTLAFSIEIEWVNVMFSANCS